MSKLSVVLGIRNWGLDRLEVCLRSHRDSEMREGLEVVVSDFGSENASEIKGLADGFGATYVFTPSDIWSRSAALNAGVGAANSPILVTADADVVFSPTSHETLLSAAEALPTAVQFVQYSDLPEGFGAADLERLDWRVLASVAQRRPRWGMGTAMFSRELFSKVRGYDERMVVWGAEDNDFAKRARKAGAAINWVDEPGARIYHIWHKRFLDIAHGNSAEYAEFKRNREIFKSDDSCIRNLDRSFSRHGTYVPTVSIVIASRNRPSLLQESIESCLRQTFQDFEIIVVDDGSEESLESVVTAIDDERVRFYRCEQHQGLPTARNIGTNLARGDFIAVQDDDDIMLPQRLQRQLSAIEDNEVAGCFGGWIDFDDETGRLVGYGGGESFGLPDFMFKSRIVLHPTLMLRRNIMAAFGYQRELYQNSDYNLAGRLANAGVKLVNCADVIILRRVHAAGMTQVSPPKRSAGSRLTLTLLRTRYTPDQLEDARRNSSVGHLGVTGDRIQELAAFLPLPLTRQWLTVSWQGTIVPLTDLVRQLVKWKLCARLSATWDGDDRKGKLYVMLPDALTYAKVEKVFADIPATTVLGPVAGPNYVIQPSRRRGFVAKIDLREGHALKKLDVIQTYAFGVEAAVDADLQMTLLLDGLTATTSKLLNRYLHKDRGERA
jgi:glycosyltransferase involved in cell wall biosynthesis